MMMKKLPVADSIHLGAQGTFFKGSEIPEHDAAGGSLFGQLDLLGLPDPDLRMQPEQFGTRD